ASSSTAGWSTPSRSTVCCAGSRRARADLRRGAGREAGGPRGTHIARRRRRRASGRRDRPGGSPGDARSVRVGAAGAGAGSSHPVGLARDVGEALGCGAHLASLRRTRVGPFRLADAVAPVAVTAHALRDPAELVRELPARELDDAGRTAVVHGRPVPAGSELRDAGWVALFANGALVAVAERVDDVLKPRVVVVEQ